MGTASKKCCGCKKRFKTETMISTPIGYFHSKECRYEYAFKNTKKINDDAREVKFKAKKKAYNENKLPTRKRAAREACHAYIRFRDKNEVCICCLEPLGDNYHAGHWLESGNNPKVRYDEDNIHAQRAYCNTYKGGDSGGYKENLIKKIGIDRVNILLEKKGGTVKLTADDYREIEKYYKDKLKELSIIR